MERATSCPLPHAVEAPSSAPEDGAVGAARVQRALSEGPRASGASRNSGLAWVLPSLGMRKQYQCRICLQSCDHCTLRGLKGCSVPSHLVCEHCLCRYLKGRIEERQLQLRCPLYGDQGCTAELGIDDLRHLPEATVQKYHRFKAMAEDPSLRECPECGELVRPTMQAMQENEEVSTPEPAMCCSKGHHFCYFHSNAHPVGPGCCEAYAQKEALETREALESQGAKECPRCKTQILKHDGCNHMVCINCQCHWCWTCGKDLGGRINLGWHYNPANPNGCMQFSVLEKIKTSRLTLLARAIALPGAILGFLIFWGTLPLWLACGLGVLISGVLLLLVGCAWCTAVSPCVCGLCCVGLTDAQAELILCAPCHSCWASVECFLGGLEP